MPGLSGVAKPMQVRFYYDVVCPYAYVASQRVRALAARSKVEVLWCPVLLGGLFRNHQTADVPAASYAPARAKVGAEDLVREARSAGLPLVHNPRHPQRSVTAMRLLTAAQGEQRIRLTHALYKAYWVDNLDINDPATLAPLAREQGLDLAVANDTATKAALREQTQRASDRGVFGVPTFEVDGTIWWGQDRIHLVEQALGMSPDYLPKGRAKPDSVIDFYHDFASPYSYLAATQIQAMAARVGAQVRMKPILLGALFKAIGTANIPVFTFGEARRAYTLRDLGDWAALWGVPFQFTPHFPVRTVTAGRVALVCEEATPVIYKAVWSDGVDISDERALQGVLEAAGLDGAGLLAAAQAPEVKAQLRANTDEAIRRGACGAPTMVVDDEVFWGTDRINRALEAVLAR